MHPGQPLRRAVKGFYAYVGSVVAAIVGPTVGMSLVHHASPGARVVGVALGVGGWVPLMLFTAALIRASDEFSQRIHLLALSLAFAGGLLLIDVLDWLVRAKFMEPVPYMALWLSLTALWVVALVIAKRRVERGPVRETRPS
jgi:hypothetical protein